MFKIFFEAAHLDLNTGSSEKRRSNSSILSRIVRNQHVVSVDHLEFPHLLVGVLLALGEVAGNLLVTHRLLGELVSNQAELDVLGESVLLVELLDFVKAAA